MKKYRLGKNSRKELATCTDNIQRVLNAAISLGLMDFSVVEGARPQYEQDRYFKLGKSKVQWPNSKHNVIKEGELSKAADVVPWINGKSSYRKSHCCYLAGLIISIGMSMGIRLRWGGNWDMDGEPITDQEFQDLVHFEEVT